MKIKIEINLSISLFLLKIDTLKMNKSEHKVFHQTTIPSLQIRHT